MEAWAECLKCIRLYDGGMQMISKPRRFSGKLKTKIALDGLRPLNDPSLKLEFGAYLTSFDLGASKIARCRKVIPKSRRGPEITFFRK